MGDRETTTRNFGRQNKANKKLRWNGWLEEENYDFLCRKALEEERSLASILNRLLRQIRSTDVPRGNI